jgi:Na+/melibiose symporter-like transporter
VQTFVPRVAGALGAAVGGIILDWIEFPQHALVSDVPSEMIFELGVIYGPVMMAFYLLSVAALFFFSIDREKHIENLAWLHSRE